MGGNSGANASGGPNQAPDEPARPGQHERAVILGASNVIRGISTVLATAERCCGRPGDILIASGHGRSYGMRSRVFGRALPGITQCGLWKALAERRPAKTVALLTDIGNDLLYGASVDTIVTWVETCLERLRPGADRLILTELPLENIERLTPAKFFAVRTLLFPRSRLSLTAAQDMAAAVNDQVKMLASSFEATLIKPAASWYGIDPIHIHHRHESLAWQAIMAPWRTEMATCCDPASPSPRIRATSCRPQVRWLCGIEQRCPQPAVQLASGTQVSFF